MVAAQRPIAGPRECLTVRREGGSDPKWSVGNVDDDWHMIRRALALTLIPIDLSLNHTRRQRGGGVHKVNAHALILREA